MGEYLECSLVAGGSSASPWSSRPTAQSTNTGLVCNASHVAASQSAPAFTQKLVSGSQMGNSGSSTQAFEPAGSQGVDDDVKHFFAAGLQYSVVALQAVEGVQSAHAFTQSLTSGSQTGNSESPLHAFESVGSHIPLDGSEHCFAAEQNSDALGGGAGIGAGVDFAAGLGEGVGAGVDFAAGRGVVVGVDSGAPL